MSYHLNYTSLSPISVDHRHFWPVAFFPRVIAVNYLYKYARQPPTDQLLRCQHLYLEQLLHGDYWYVLRADHA